MANLRSDTELDPVNDWTPEEWKKILICAWGGMLLPTPCAWCNGLFSHRPYCPTKGGSDA